MIIPIFVDDRFHFFCTVLYVRVSEPIYFIRLSAINETEKKTKTKLDEQINGHFGICIFAFNPANFMYKRRIMPVVCLAFFSSSLDSWTALRSDNECIAMYLHSQPHLLGQSQLQFPVPSQC